MEKQELELLSTKADELIKIINNENSKKKFSEIRQWKDEFSYIFILNSCKEIKRYIVFEKSVEVKLNTVNKVKDSISFNIRTNLELYNFITQTELDYERITILNEDKNKLKDCIDIINICVKNFVLNLEIIKGDIPDIKFDNNCLEMERDYTPDTYSKYFELYFPSAAKDKNKLFSFIYSEKRKQIRRNIIFLNNSKTVKKYKLTGPFSTGKSMTLFKISKSCINVIYINLKIMKKYTTNYYGFLEILFEESSRVYLSNEKQAEFKKKIKLIFLEKGIYNILIQVLELFLELNNNQSITLILDQFKSSNINDDLSFKENIEKLNKEKNLKIVYCSSINDNEARDDLMPTFIKYKGNIIYLNDETQEFYFYYPELYPIQKSNNITNLLFNDKIKYIDMIDKKNFETSLKKVDEKIKKKLDNFKNYQGSKNVLINNYDLVDILLFLKDIVTKEEEYSTSNLLNIVPICPLKYFVIYIEKDKFTIKTIFPYIEYFISEYIKKQDSADYFRCEKYKNISFLSIKVKGEYFEYAAKEALKQNLSSKYGINKDIFVDQIAEMNEITTPFDYFLLKLKKKFIKDNPEEEEEKDEEIEEMEGEEKIEINLDDPINEEEIKKKIKKNYSNDLKDFNIFEKKEVLEKEKKDILEKLKPFGVNKNYEDYINKVFCKKVDDYRIDDFEKKVSKRYEKMIKTINRAKTKNKNKRKIYIPIKEKKKINEENKVIDKYNGDENVLIDQTNTNGKIVDYAFLLGKKNEKKLVLFQMKCYSSDSSLDEIFINKTKLKEELSSLLINSIRLFNCKIIGWYYILIFYYNDKDDMANNVGLRTLFSCINRDIEFYLFNPGDGKYYMRASNFNIKEKKSLDLFTNESDLDQYSLMKFINLIDIKKFNNTIFQENSKKEYLEALIKFFDELKKLNINISILQKELEVENLEYFCHLKIGNEIFSPRANLIFLYKKKDSNNFIAAKNSFNEIIFYDLENREKIQKILEKIDLKYDYVYVLSFGKKATEKTTSNKNQNEGEYMLLKRDPIPKLN